MTTDRDEKWVVCRVCLKNPNDGDGELQDIFSASAATRLDQMLHICGDIPISEDDKLPDKMCSKCVRCLRLAYKFRMTVQRSHQHLMDMMKIDTDQAHISDELTVDDFPAETIVWDCDEMKVKIEEEELKEQQQHQQLVEQLEVDEGVRYLIAKDVGHGEEILFDEFVEEAEAVENVIYSNASVDAIDEDAENCTEYEQLEVLSTEASALNTAYELRTRQNAHISVTDDEADVLSSDDEEYKPNVRANNTTQQARKSKVTMVTLTEAKKKGRRPRDKNLNYICDVCGNIYPTQARLTEHMKFHSGVKPHECEICGRGFVQNQQLVRHMNTHTGNRPYKCNFCPAAFADRSTKTKHHRIHTKERPYECDVCHKTFTYSDNLKFHKMIHTGEKPHVCDICGKGFVKAYKMRLHRVTHEKRPWKQVSTMDVLEDEEYVDETPETIIT